MTDDLKHCLNCNNKFFPNRRWQTFCCNFCKNDYHKKEQFMKSKESEVELTLKIICLKRVRIKKLKAELIEFQKAYEASLQYKQNLIFILQQEINEFDILTDN